MVEQVGGSASWAAMIVGLLAGYLAGSVPFGLMLTKLGGAGDIRAIGSGNIGATNVLRTGRRGLALATLIFDILKGALPVWVALRWWGPDVAAMVGAGAIVGHCFPLWLGFKGGKGVATAGGVILALSPMVLLPIFLVFAVVFYLTSFVSLGSILAALAAPLTAWAMGQPTLAILYVLIAALVIYKHSDNIRRLLAGNESKTSLGSKRAG